MVRQSQNRIALGLALAFLPLAWSACGNAPAKNEASSAPAAAVPDEESSAAKAALGSGAEVLVYGPLGGAGTHQVVAVNRLPNANAVAETPAASGGSPVTGVEVARVSILSKDNGNWTEVLRCDEHLKNPKGYLRGAPTLPVAGWRLDIDQQTEKGRILHFTPLAPPAAAKGGGVAVAWNPNAKRYQSLDHSGAQFLGETPTLGLPSSKLR